MAAFVAVLRLEDCVAADPDRGPELLWLILIISVIVAEIVGFVTDKLVGLPVSAIVCIVSIFCYESILGRFALVERAGIWIAIA
jgi:hypothetical protein